jgi:hypothetical protein
VPAKPHPAMRPLEDITTPIWRYMNFTKFVSMLTSHALHFARADTLGDPIEGTLPRATREQFDDRVRDLVARGPCSAASRLKWSTVWCNFVGRHAGRRL